MVINWYEVIIRLFIAVIVGGAVGREREQKNMPAGFRTHILVCVGAAVISIIELYQIQDLQRLYMQDKTFQSAVNTNLGRLAAQVITGVGFLGAGTIIHEKGSVKGLTTAASVWVVACIGIGIGYGYYFLSISAAIMVLVSLGFLKNFDQKFLERGNTIKIEICYTNRKELVRILEEYFEAYNIKIKNIEFSAEEVDDGIMHYTSCYTLLVPKSIQTEKLIDDVGILKDVERVTWA